MAMQVNLTLDFLVLNICSQHTIFSQSVYHPDLIQLVGYSTDDSLVSEVEMEPLKIHLPVNPLVPMCLSKGDEEYLRGRLMVTEK